MGSGRVSWGTFESDNTCVDCAAGFFHNETAQTECVACADGFVSNPGAVACSACGRGTFESDNVCVNLSRLR